MRRFQREYRRIMLNISEKNLQVILALCDNDMNVSDAARQLGVHRNTVEKHCVSIQKKTGYNIKRFHDLRKIYNMLEEKSPD